MVQAQFKCLVWRWTSWCLPLLLFLNYLSLKSILLHYPKLHEALWVRWLHVSQYSHKTHCWTSSICEHPDKHSTNTTRRHVEQSNAEKRRPHLLYGMRTYIIMPLVKSWASAVYWCSHWRSQNSQPGSSYSAVQRFGQPCLSEDQLGLQRGEGRLIHTNIILGGVDSHLVASFTSPFLFKPLCFPLWFSLLHLIWIEMKRCYASSQVTDMWLCPAVRMFIKMKSGWECECDKSKPLEVH